MGYILALSAFQHFSKRHKWTNKNVASSRNKYVGIIKRYNAPDYHTHLLRQVLQKQFGGVIYTCAVSSRIFPEIIIKALVTGTGKWTFFIPTRGVLVAVMTALIALIDV